MLSVLDIGLICTNMGTLVAWWRKPRERPNLLTAVSEPIVYSSPVIVPSIATIPEEPTLSLGEPPNISHPTCPICSKTTPIIHTFHDGTSACTDCRV